MAVAEHTIDLGGSPVFYREARSDGPPVVYLHGAPTSSDDWTPFLERTGGIAPDMLGFGRSAKAVNLVFTIDSHADFVGDLLSALDVDRIRLVGHGSGAGAGLVLAQRDPDRIEKLVLIDALPLFSGFVWPWPARLLRTRVVGELAMGSITRRVFEHGLRSGAATPGAWTAERLRTMWEQFDQGTQRAILRLLRDCDEHQLTTAGQALDTLAMPTLVVWGERDPWLPATLADGYASRVPRAELRKVPGAGHWPWLDDPTVVDTIAAFLS